MLADSILIDFISRLDSNISVLLYDFTLKTLNKAIQKVKIIKIDQKNIVKVI